MATLTDQEVQTALKALYTALGTKKEAFAVSQETPGFYWLRPEDFGIGNIEALINKLEEG